MKIKARNFLSNIAYSRICDGDFSNASVVADTLVYITMDLKSFFLKMTYFDSADIEMVKMLWYQYVYSHLFPKTYANRAGFQKKVQFSRYLERWNRKKMQSLGKNPFNFSVPAAD